MIWEEGVKMEEMIFSGYGCDIFRHDGKYYLRHDVGHFNIEMRDDQISEEEAIKAQKTKQDLIELIRKCVQRYDQMHSGQNK